MYATRRSKLIGLLYLTPALLFVAVFTFYPFVQMLWVSLNSWSLLTPPKYIGLDNFANAFEDRQFWVSLAYTLEYTLIVTPVLMIGGYLIALLTARNTPTRRLTRAVVFVPVVIGLGSRASCGTGCSARTTGSSTAPMDLGVIDEPVLWLGVSADVSTFAIIVSVTWKVIGFGMILFVAAIQRHPQARSTRPPWSTAPAPGSASVASRCR